MSEITRTSNYWDIYDNCKNLGKKLGRYVAIIPYSNYTCVTLDIYDENIFNQFYDMLKENYNDVKDDPFLKSFYIK